MDSYQQLLERIAHASQLSKEVVEQKVEAKRAKLSGLVSKEGAAQIVAAELGVNFDKEKFTIVELAGIKRANVVGQIVELYPVRSYVKNGREGKVATLLLGDSTGTIRTVLWDINHIALVEQGQLHTGDTIEISNGMLRNGELHLSSFADIKQSAQKLTGVVTKVSVQDRLLVDAKPGMQLVTRAFVVQAFDPRYFIVCGECGKRLGEGGCVTHGIQEGKKRALLNVVIDDGSENMRAVLFTDQLLQLGMREEQIFSLEAFLPFKEQLLGQEFMFTGTIKQNQLYNTAELSVQSVAPVESERLLTVLQTHA